MNAWLADLNIQKVKPIADGNGDFTRHMGMLVKKEAVNFGYRSQRYSTVVDNGLIEMISPEQGKEDDLLRIPFDVSDATPMLNYPTDIRDVRRDESADAIKEAEANESNETEDNIQSEFGGKQSSLDQPYNTSVDKVLELLDKAKADVPTHCLSIDTKHKQPTNILRISNGNE